MAKLEIACFNAESALVAQNAGADRVELCVGYDVGGVTPSHEMLESLMPQLRLPAFVMIRPRGGDFLYSESEFLRMKQDIEKLKPAVDGFVFGILDDRSEVDKVRNLQLVQSAKPKPCTFHRAFDAVEDPDRALEDVVECGFATILTSGGASNATDGAEAIARLVQRARGRIEIMPGGSVRSSNVDDLKRATRATFFHSAAITAPAETADPIEIASLKAKL